MPDYVIYRSMFSPKVVVQPVKSRPLDVAKFVRAQLSTAEAANIIHAVQQADSAEQAYQKLLDRVGPRRAHWDHPVDYRAELVE